MIEYGPLDHHEAAVLVPGLLNLTQTPYSFNLTSVPQLELNNRTFGVPAAAVVGGGTVINGMFFDRGSAADYDAWESLGNPGWGWNDLLPYFKKVTFPSSVGSTSADQNNRARTSHQQPKALQKRSISDGIILFTDLVGQFNQAIPYFNFRRLVRLAFLGSDGPAEAFSAY